VAGKSNRREIRPRKETGGGRGFKGRERERERSHYDRFCPHFWRARRGDIQKAQTEGRTDSKRAFSVLGPREGRLEIPAAIIDVLLAKHALLPKDKSSFNGLEAKKEELFLAMEISMHFVIILKIISFGRESEMPMIPLGLKETKEIDFRQPLADFVAEHYSEDPADYDDAVAELMDVRQAMRTPARDATGVALLFEHFNQLYFLERRFFPPDRSLGIFFEW